MFYDCNLFSTAKTLTFVSLANSSSITTFLFAPAALHLLLHSICSCCASFVTVLYLLMRSTYIGALTAKYYALLITELHLLLHSSALVNTDFQRKLFCSPSMLRMFNLLTSTVRYAQKLNHSCFSSKILVYGGRGGAT